MPLERASGPYGPIHSLSHLGPESIGGPKQLKIKEVGVPRRGSEPSAGKGTDWIYHAQLGWIYAQSDDRQGLWLWKNEEGWMWTRRRLIPTFGKTDLGGWLYLMVSRNGKPVFYHYESGSIR